MIHIDSPSMVINDVDAPSAYSMDVTRSADRTTSVRAMVQMILADAQTVPGAKFQSLVLNGHGRPGEIDLGAGLNGASMFPFAEIKGKVFKIWITSCLVARIIGRDTAGQPDGAALQAAGITSGNGHQFCSNLAKLTGCYVVASTEVQVSKQRSYPHGVKDSYEGLVLSYDPEGRISWQHQYPSVYDIDLNARKAMGADVD